MTNLNEQMEMFDKEISEKKELNKLNKLFSKGVTSLKEQFSEEELKNKLERLKYLKNLLKKEIVKKSFSNWHERNPKIIGGSKDVDYDIFRYRQLSREEVTNYE